MRQARSPRSLLLSLVMATGLVPDLALADSLISPVSNTRPAALSGKEILEIVTGNTITTNDEKFIYYLFFRPDGEIFKVQALKSSPHKLLDETVDSARFFIRDGKLCLEGSEVHACHYHQFVNGNLTVLNDRGLFERESVIKGDPLDIVNRTTKALPSIREAQRSQTTRDPNSVPIQAGPNTFQLHMPTANEIYEESQWRQWCISRSFFTGLIDDVEHPHNGDCKPGYELVRRKQEPAEGDK